MRESAAASPLRSIPGVAVMLALLVYLWRGERGEPMRRGFAAGVVLFGLLMVVVLPARSWRDAWPAALASAVLEGQAGSGGIDLPSLANVSASPRNRFESWQAHREHGPGYAETYVLVIGESVRSDRVPGCGGRPQVAPPPDPARRSRARDTALVRLSG